MTTPSRRASVRRRLLPAAAAATLSVLLLPALTGPAYAATATVELGTSEAFSVLAGSAVTNVPTSTLTGDVGVSPAAGASVTDLTCAEVDGSIYTVDVVDAADAECRQVDPGLLTTARAAQSVAYGDAAGRTPDTTFPGGDNQLGGQTLVGGVYRFGNATTANLVGNLTLNGDASSVWIFQATSDLVFASNSTVTLTGGAQACNVFWQVGSAATLGTDSDLVGTIMAGAGIAAQTRASIEGRLLADTAVTLDMNTITRPGCAEIPPTPTVGPDTPTSAPGTGSGGSPQVPQVPSGPVGAGDGSSAVVTDPLTRSLTLTAMLGLLVLSAVTMAHLRRRS